MRLTRSPFSREHTFQSGRKTEHTKVKIRHCRVERVALLGWAQVSHMRISTDTEVWDSHSISFVLGSWVLCCLVTC